MDCYSLSVEQEASKNIEENEREWFKDAIVSSRSLNKGFVEPTTIRNAIREIIACIVAASFHIVVGFIMAYSAILIPHFEKDDAKLHATQEETFWIASLTVVCAPIGALVADFLMEMFGRLRTLQIGAIPSVIGSILIATSTNIPMLLVGRLLTGLAITLSTSPAIVYITEVARPELRGSLISFGTTLASFGMVLCYLKGAYLQWDLVAYLSLIYAIVPILLVQLIVPESPVWLVSKGRIDDAKKSLEWLHENETSESKTSMAEVQFINIMKENEIKLNEQRRSKYSSTSNKWRGFLKPNGWKPMKVGAGVDAYMASILVSLTFFLYSMVNTWLLRRYKRRSLCIISSFGMALCMIVSGYFTLNIKNGDRSGYWVPVACVLLYVCTSIIGMLTIPWTMTAELFPTEIRGIAHSISFSMANLLMFAALQSYRSLQAFLGGAYAVQWFFAGVSVEAAIFVWVLLPKTHGKQLSEIEEYFHNNFLALGAKNKDKSFFRRCVIGTMVFRWRFRGSIYFRVAITAEDS
ncbi:hypothetical protein PUN28_008296 [Cardiocondyla obscurior]|uniref:Major facilitator superfamily (MFS) profile domain-containing protein n=1 Tax=Cardiocondyla obscurior TaxID=286306 RepID=A0AAW2FWX4_9HYME